jgi:hypothetical protein
MMTRSVCLSCRSPKTQHACGVCGEPLCRDCALFLDESAFAFRSSVAPELKHTYYCQGCHAEHVEPALAEYGEVMERARNVYCFTVNSKKRFIPLLKRAQVEVRVEGCGDRDETFLRLAFQAAELGFNAVIEADVQSEKVRNGGYQTSLWRGRAVPANVDTAKIERDRERE